MFQNPEIPRTPALDLKTLAASTLATIACLYYKRWDDQISDPGRILEKAVRYAVHMHGNRFDIANIESDEVRHDIVERTHRAIDDGDFTPVSGKWAKWTIESDENSLPMLWIIEEILRGRRVFKRITGRQTPAEAEAEAHRITTAPRDMRAGETRAHMAAPWRDGDEPPF
jgi:hypothetical protein